MSKSSDDTIYVFGLEIDNRNGAQRIVRGRIDTSKPGDYGADPIGDGTFRMVPSGDVVSYAERCKRLAKQGT